MKICLIILGQTLTTFTMCRMVERLGFKASWSKGGLHAYHSESEDALEIVVLDMEDQDTRGDALTKKLDTLSRKVDSLILFCTESEDKERLNKILDDGRKKKWQITPINITKFSENACTDKSKSRALGIGFHAFSDFTKSLVN